MIGATSVKLGMSVCFSAPCAGARGLRRPYRRTEVRRTIDRPFFGMMGKDNPDWYRSDTFFTDRRLLVWEHPATRPKGDQLDVVESSDIENGLIAYHRGY